MSEEKRTLEDMLKIFDSEDEQEGSALWGLKIIIENFYKSITSSEVPTGKKEILEKIIDLSKNGTSEEKELVVEFLPLAWKSVDRIQTELGIKNYKGWLVDGDSYAYINEEKNG